MTEAKSELPEVIVVGRPTIFKFYDEELSKKFRMLKSWESSLSLENYICKHAQSVKAMICSPKYVGSQISSSVFRLLPSLRLIVTTSTGLDHIDLVECRRRGISIASASTLFSEDVADFAVGLLIDVVRRISAADRFVKNGLWPLQGQFPLGSKVGSRKVGIVGLGSIGLKVAQRLEAFRCTISYQSRNKKPVSYPFYPDVYELATNCDVLVICCALTEQTHHLINKEILLALGKRGVVINIARGAIINEMELVQCLEQGEIAGAGLDVFENEPNVPKELLSLDNVVLTRHIAFFTEDSMRAIYELVCGNLEALFFNKPLITPLLD
ncbi:LOW QUALITY PROTEIN: glyoxylate/hydroxypyruvate reductase HPR3 [Solanum stenotomum]|uniref:LOW QUALITY PROTEIN: glyoxylate/hydroxypyruvate reductase HPR3 n=1 Tax=Solanum stenotomum TaxID=172797 RepID=UPI0020CFF0FD|nr:LOW QUALITY PROTEIN: glyoxylate/hydroxypyruvate reductase HPR3 [Solanum stenotomum]